MSKIKTELDALRERLLKKFGKKFRYVGNTETKEFHSIRRAKPECNADKIANPLCYFTGRKAREAGLDACGHCSVYWKSKDNQ